MSFGNTRNRTIFLIVAIAFAAVIGGLLGWTTNYRISQKELSIEGSSTVYKIVSNSTKEFLKTHPNIQIVITSTSSSAGIVSLTQGLVDIAMLSRAVDVGENQSSGGVLKSFALAKDVLAVVVNSMAASFSLSIDIIRAVFNGTITEWTHPLVSASGLTGDIQVVVREPGSGTRDFFNEFIMGDITQQMPGSVYITSAIEKSSSQLMYEDIALNLNYIGYLGLGFLDSSIKAIKIDGIEPSYKTIMNRTYPIQRNLYFVTKGIPAQGSIIREFINWSLSPIGQQIVEENGFVPIIQTTINNFLKKIVIYNQIWIRHSKPYLLISYFIFNI